MYGSYEHILPCKQFKQILPCKQFEQILPCKQFEQILPCKRFEKYYKCTCTTVITSDLKTLPCKGLLKNTLTNDVGNITLLDD